MGWSRVGADLWRLWGFSGSTVAASYAEQGSPGWAALRAGRHTAAWRCHVLRHDSELDAGDGELSRPSSALEESSPTTQEADVGVSAIFHTKGCGHSGACSQVTALARRGRE